MFGRLLGWYTVCTFSGALAPDRILLHGTPAAAVSQTLRRGIQGMELRNLRKGRHLYSAGRPSRCTSARILVTTESSLLFNNVIINLIIRSVKTASVIPKDSFSKQLKQERQGATANQ